MPTRNIDQIPEVIAGNPTKRDEYNLLMMYATYLGVNNADFNDTPLANVTLAQLFIRWMQNMRPQALGTTQIRIPFSPERPPSMILDNHLIQSTADVDSAMIAGGAGTRFIMAVRSVKTFTIVIRTSAVEGDDERLLGSFSWSGTAIVSGTIVGYELEGIGGIVFDDPEIVKVWVSSDNAGNILESFNVDSITKTGTGVYQINYSITFQSSVYCAIVTCNNDNKFAVARDRTVNDCDVATHTSTGSAEDDSFSLVILGEL